MLNLTYLKSILSNETITGISSTDQIIESAAGYDGIIQLIQTKNMEAVVILEHNEVGEMGIKPGGLLSASQSLWYMSMVRNDADRTSVQNSAFEAVKKIISVLVKNENNEHLEGWNWESIPYAVRNAGSNFTGYEFTLQYTENIDLSYHERTEQQNG